MRDELQNTLYEKYPKIFVEKDLSMQETCMCWGIGTGDGWFELIDRLCATLQFHTDKNGYPQVVATQVKEKFGRLRFYHRYVEPETPPNFPRPYEFLEGMIDFAEIMSENTCEICGEKGKVQTKNRWVSVRCEKCE